MNNGNYDLIIVDLPGTVNSSGVINTIVNMDYVITPIIPDRIVMQSSLSFSTIVWDYAKTSKEAPLRESSFSGPVKMPALPRKFSTLTISSCKNWNLRYWIPSSRKPTANNKELSLTTRNFFRCTLFPPPAKSLKGSGLTELAEELLVKFKK